MFIVKNKCLLSKQWFLVEYITAYACQEIGFPCYRGVLFQSKDRHITEVDVLIDLGKVLFFIECKDTYSFTDKDLRRFIIYVKTNCLSYGIFVCSKAINNLNYKKYDLELVKYKYNYHLFKSSLKILTKRLSIYLLVF